MLVEKLAEKAIIPITQFMNIAFFHLTCSWPIHNLFDIANLYI